MVTYVSSIQVSVILIPTVLLFFVNIELEKQCWTAILLPKLSAQTILELTFSKFLERHKNSFKFFLMFLLPGELKNYALD